jgi:hypothetical protein
MKYEMDGKVIPAGVQIQEGEQHNTGPFRFGRIQLDNPHTGRHKNAGPSVLRIVNNVRLEEHA